MRSRHGEEYPRHTCVSAIFRGGDLTRHHSECSGGSHETGRHKGDFPTRLYEEEENKLVLKWVGKGHVRYRKPIDDRVHRRGLTYRMLRFCETIQGFHLVSFTYIG